MDCFYSRHHVIINMLRDPVLSFVLVFFYYIPILQIGASFLIILAYLILELVYKPSKNKKDNKMAIFDFSVYTLAQTLFLVLAFVDNKISVKNKNIFFGWPLIILLCAIIVVKQFFSIKDSIISIKEKCKKLKEEKNDEKENFNKAKQVQPGPIDKPENSSTSLNQQPIMIAIAPNKISSARNQALSRKRIKAEAESVPRPKIKFGNLENIG